MRNWKCLKCNKYKPIDYKNINVGDTIFFYRNKVKANKVDKIISSGNIIDINQDLVSVDLAGVIYQCQLNEVYPFKAPAKITYDIFGVCQC